MELKSKRLIAVINQIVKDIREQSITVESLEVVDEKGRGLLKLSFNEKLDYKKVAGLRVVGRSEDGHRLTKFCMSDKKVKK